MWEDSPSYAMKTQSRVASERHVAWGDSKPLWDRVIPAESEPQRLKWGIREEE